MTSENLKNTDPNVKDANPDNSSHVVMADSVQAEVIPTIPIESLETINALQPEVSVHSVASTEDVSAPAPLVVQPAEYHRTFKEWLQIWKDGVRLHYLPLGLMPLLVGSVLAWMPTVSPQNPLGRFHFLHITAAIIALVLLQMGANLANDYHDYLRGVDTSNALGPGGLIQQGLIKPTRVLLFGLGLLGLGAVVGLIISLTGGPLLLLFGLVTLLCAYFYSATTRALSTIALGELASFLVFGPILTIGAYMLQSGGSMSSLALLYSLPFGCLAAATIHANNMRDAEDDQHAHKHTLANLLGVRWSRALYSLLLVVSYAVIVALAVPHGTPHLILITLWTLPEAVIAFTGALRTVSPAALHLVMRQTLQIETAFAILLIIALIITTLFPVLPLIPAKILPV
jgi:1,4-dihydroxy-2-naphthoate octaprenyltransferase